MVFQVLTRASARTAWEPFQSMTRNPLFAMALVRKACESAVEVSVIQAPSALQLREQLRQLRAGQSTSGAASPVPSLTATPRVSLASSNIESQRWVIERGAGGDHDLPYRFDGAISDDLLHRWSRLVAAAQIEDRDTPVSQPAETIPSDYPDDESPALSAESVDPTLAPIRHAI